MLRDDFLPSNLVSGPCKRTLTEKAKEAVVTSTKRVRSTAEKESGSSHMHPSKPPCPSSRPTSKLLLSSTTVYLYIIHSGYYQILNSSPKDVEDETDIAEDEDLGDDNSSSRSPTPLESDGSGDDNDTEVFEVSDGDDEAQEKPAESAQAELSTRSSLLHCTTHQ
jgi:hypothetical protein